ncbi:MAG: ComF family protein [Ruminococcaceae bacterium]|nr:ComF family protein [Oscillospiraceae bacterium]MBQ7119004.1 ComF family protein [Oscillospiraceae bacterium]
MSIISSIGKWLFPPKCVFCRKVLPKDGICDKCKNLLPYRRPMKSKDSIMFVDGAYSCFHYEGNVRDAIIRYKFGGLNKYAADFAEFLKICVEENLEGEYDIISWVPLSKKRLRKRGYDQAKCLAEQLCIRLGKTPVGTLVKCRDAAPQSRQSNPSSRRANVLGAYEIDSADVSGKRIILLDDVLTTGSTASECARILKTAGAEKVYLITIAKTRSAKKN